MATNAQKATLHIAGTSAAAKNITAVAVGNPTVITSVAHGLANGDAGPIAAIVGTLGTNATKGLNGKTVTIKYVTADTFVVDLDSTGLVYTSGGTFTPSAWIKVGQISNIKGAPDTSAENDETTLDDDLEVFSPGLKKPGSVTADIFCDDSDVGLVAMEAAHDAGRDGKKAFKITYPAGATPVRSFSGYVVSFPKIGDISKGALITGSIEIKRTTLVTKS